MRITVFSAAFLALSLSSGTAAAAGDIEITFSRMDTYTDAQRTYSQSRSREEVTVELAKYLQELTKRYLPDGQLLSVMVVDIDLAGRFEPGARNPDVRFMRDVTWPSIKLKWTLSEAGKVIKTKDETVSDQNYLQHAAPHSSESLFYEKRMLDQWFRKNFSAKK